MDVISWAVALVAGIAQPSLKRAIVAGVATSIAIRVGQVVLVDEGAWGNDMPEDLFGGIAMILITVVFAWLGSIIRRKVVQRRGAQS